MAAEIFDLFPLSIFKDKILLQSNEKKEIINYILNIEKKTKNTNKRKHDAWLGDTKGHEFLLKDPKMHKLSKLIGEKIKAYTEMLSVDITKINFFYQRSWATITRKKENIKIHSHDQSNISFAYYPLKPENSGNISFLVEPPQNEFAAGLLHQEKINTGLLKNFDKRNAPTVDIHTKEDDIVIFPSKTKHATNPNSTEKPRISISGDISIMLKDSFGHERLMPHYNQWQSF